jgi:hypothetical protein
VLLLFLARIALQAAALNSSIPVTCYMLVTCSSAAAHTAPAHNMQAHLTAIAVDVNIAIAPASCTCVLAPSNRVTHWVGALHLGARGAVGGT